MRIFNLIGIWLIWFFDPQTPSPAADAFLLAMKLQQANDQYALAAKSVNKAAWAIVRGNYDLASDRLQKAEECLDFIQRHTCLGLEILSLRIMLRAVDSSPHIVFRPQTPES